jgi:GNAT superfamily N-acetyltransferase
MRPDEAGAVAELWRAYMAEAHGAPGDMTAEVFLRDGQGECFHTMVARAPDRAPVAVAAWWMTYDVHHGVRGGEVPDMYVTPRARGLGVAVQVIAAVAREVRGLGGVFLRGPATAANAKRLIDSGHLNGAFPLVHVYWSEAILDALATNAEADARSLVRRVTAAARASPPPALGQ